MTVDKPAETANEAAKSDVPAVRTILTPGGGYATVTPEQAERWRQVQAAKAARDATVGNWMDPNFQRASRERVEREAAERLAAKGDPRNNLRETHAHRTSALAEVARLEGVIARAVEYRDGVRARQDGIAAALREADAEAAQALTAAFATGAETLPASGKTAPQRASLAQAERDLELAESALSRLEVDLATARTWVQRSQHQVAVAAFDVLLAAAVANAHAVLDLDRELYDRRRDLQGLALVLSTEGHRLFSGAPALPPVINRSLTPVDRVLRDVPRGGPPPANWRSAFIGLVADAEARLPGDLAPEVADEAVAEAPVEDDLAIPPRPGTDS